MGFGRIQRLGSSTHTHTHTHRQTDRHLGSFNGALRHVYLRKCIHGPFDRLATDPWHRIQFPARIVYRKRPGVRVRVGVRGG